ncbi:hypothetical protein EON66_05545, partial [archaeon]
MHRRGYDLIAHSGAAGVSILGAPRACSDPDSIRCVRPPMEVLQAPAGALPALGNRRGDDAAGSASYLVGESNVVDVAARPSAATSTTLDSPTR